MTNWLSSIESDISGGYQAVSNATSAMVLTASKINTMTGQTLVSDVQKFAADAASAGTDITNYAAQGFANAGLPLLKDSATTLQQINNAGSSIYKTINTGLDSSLSNVQSAFSQVGADVSNTTANVRNLESTLSAGIRQDLATSYNDVGAAVSGLGSFSAGVGGAVTNAEKTMTTLGYVGLGIAALVVAALVLKK